MLPKTAVIVLAAGLSTRFGPADKLLAELHGKPVVARVLDTVRTLGLGQRIVVTRENSPVISLASDFDVVINPQPEAGMGRSLALGVQAIEDDIEAVFIALGDMPFVEPSAYHAMLTAFEANETDIVVPVYEGQQGHPVMFGRACFASLRQLDGPAGARAIMASFRVWQVELAGSGGLVDLDTPVDLERSAESFGTANERE